MLASSGISSIETPSEIRHRYNFEFLLAVCLPLLPSYHVSSNFTSQISNPLLYLFCPAIDRKKCSETRENPQLPPPRWLDNPSLSKMMQNLKCSCWLWAAMIQLLFIWLESGIQQYVFWTRIPWPFLIVTLRPSYDHNMRYALPWDTCGAAKGILVVGGRGSVPDQLPPANGWKHL